MAGSLFDIRQYLLENLIKSEKVNRGDHVDPKTLNLDGLVISVGNFEYGEVSKEPLTKPQYLDTVEDKNGTSKDQSQIWERTYTTNATVSWSVTNGIRHTGTISIGVNIPGDIVHIEASYALEISAETTESQSQSVEQVWKLSVPIITPPHTRTETTIVVDMASFSAPFTFSAMLLGDITFDVWYYPEDHDPNLSESFQGNLSEFIPGMQLPNELTLKNGMLVLNGVGIFTGVAGVKEETERDEYPYP
jgi:hypothetical protein